MGISSVLNPSQLCFSLPPLSSLVRTKEQTKSQWGKKKNPMALEKSLSQKDFFLKPHYFSHLICSLPWTCKFLNLFNCLPFFLLMQTANMISQPNLTILTSLTPQIKLMKFLGTIYNSFQGKVLWFKLCRHKFPILKYIFVDFSISEYSFIKDRVLHLEKKSNNFAGNID